MNMSKSIRWRLLLCRVIAKQKQKENRLILCVYTQWISTEMYRTLMHRMIMKQQVKNEQIKKKTDLSFVSCKCI